MCPPLAFSLPVLDRSSVHCGCSGLPRRPAYLRHLLVFIFRGHVFLCALQGQRKDGRSEPPGFLEGSL